jgi:hypothetical protein
MNRRQIIDMLKQMIMSFMRDPADSDYQRGYEAALREVYTRATEDKM